MGGIGSEEETSYAEFFGATLVHFVGTAVDEFVLIWFGVAGEHSLEFHGLSGDHLIKRQFSSEMTMENSKNGDLPPRELGQGFRRKILAIVRLW